MPDPQIPHLRVPLHFAGTTVPKLELVEQDSEAEIAQCVEAVLRHHVGHRPEQPEFGITEQAFVPHTPDNANREILNAVDRWEPRAEVTVTQQFDANDQSLRVRVEVRSREDG